MSDLVERSDVIKMINRLIEDKDKCIVKDESFREGMVDGYCRVRSDLHDVPSAQPDVPDTNVGDTISRQAVLDKFQKICDSCRELTCRSCYFESAIDIVENEPSAQPERKTGQWQEDTSGYGFWICSACGFVSEASGADLLYNFCPHCGADMRGEDE